MQGEGVCVLSAKSDGKVNNGTIYNRSKYGRRHLCNNFSEEVRTDWVHIIVHLSQKHWTLVWENQNDALDSVEGNSHSHKEQGTITVLDTLGCLISVVEKDNSESSGNDSNNEFDNGGLGQSKLI
jgi:hypothetical protein